MNHRANSERQEARACRQLNKAVGQPFILSFISKPPIRHSHTRPGARSPGGGEREGAGLGRLLRNPEAESEPGQRANWVPGSRNPSFFPSSRYLQVIQVSTRPSPSVTGSWDSAQAGPSRPSAPAIPRPRDPRLPHGSSGPGSAPSHLPFPPSCAPAEASRGHASAARPASATSVPTGSALWVRGRGPG